MLKRFMDSLPQNSTLVKALALMRKCKTDYRFFVERTLRPGDSKPKDKLGYLRHMVRNVARSKQVCIYVVEALLIAIYLGNDLILVDIRKPSRSSTCLVRYSWSLPS
jgi:hypothetical protein